MGVDLDEVKNRLLRSSERLLRLTRAAT